MQPIFYCVSNRTKYVTPKPPVWYVAHSLKAHKYQELGRNGKYIFDGDTWYLWILDMERVSCLRSGAYNFEVAPRYLENFCTPDTAYWGTRWRSWLRHCATSRKVAGSIPDGVIGNFHWHNPSGRTIAPGSTQPLTEMSTGNISWG